MTSKLNFDAAPFEYFGEATETFSEASPAEPEQYMGSLGGPQGGVHRHHHHHRHHHRRRRRFSAPPWPVSSFPIEDSDDDDDSLPPAEGAGDFEAEGEYLYGRGGSNWHRRHHWGSSGRPHWGQQSVPFSSFPFGGFAGSQSEPDSFELEDDIQIRDHRRQGTRWGHAGVFANPWRGNVWETRRAPWRRAPSYWATGRHWGLDSARDPRRRWRWNTANAGRWPRYANRRWWPSAALQEPYGDPSGVDFSPSAPHAPGASDGPSEYVRWAQATLNDVLGLQLPISGMADAATRSAIRMFQQQQGLPADGIIGPGTEHALAVARTAGSPSASAMPPPGMAGPPPSGAPASPVGAPLAPDLSVSAGAPPSPAPSMPAPSTQSPEFDFEWEDFATAGTPVATGCSPEPGEVAASHSEAGVLAKEVENTTRGILIADFGVDWRSVKERAKAELKPWLQMLESNRSVTEIWICGYSDCIGPSDARYHTWLRTARARRVFNLLGPVARSKVKSVGPAPTGTYFAPNSDRVGRARNRSVLIVYKTAINMEPTDIQLPDTLDRIIRRGFELVKNADQFGIKFTGYQQQRINCILTLLSRQDSDDRYLTAQGVLDYKNRVIGVADDKPYYAQAGQWLLPEFDVKSKHRVRDDEIRHRLWKIDEDIIQGRWQINYFFGTHGEATPKRVRELRDWVAAQENNNRSIYWCYGSHGP